MKCFSVVSADPAWKCKDQLPGKGRGAGKHYKTMDVEEICGLARTFIRYRDNKPRRQLYLQMSGTSAPIADDAILFLWRLAAMPMEALHVVQEWGFTPKSELVWAKYRPCVECNGSGSSARHRFDHAKGKWVVPDEPCMFCRGTGCGTPAFGMGRYVRNQHETCLIATRGKMASKIQSHSVRSVLHAPMPWDHRKNRAIHSAKPERFFSDIVEKLAKGPYLELFGRRRRPGWTVLGNQVGKLQKVA